jgi:lysozyme
MKINQAGLNIVKEFEGLRLSAYKCPAGVWTIGYGHTEGVTRGMQITKEEAEDLLRHDLQLFENGVKRFIGDAPTNENQFSAFVSLAYNIGITAFGKSSALREHKSGNYELAANKIMLWNKAGGKVLAGLIRRRKAESKLYAIPV